MTSLGPLFTNLAEDAKQYGDADRALVSARRRRTLRRATGSTLAAIAVTSVLFGLPLNRPDTNAIPTTSNPASPLPSPVAEPFAATCAVSRLPLPTGYTYSTITAADPTGRLVAGLLDPDNDNRRRPALWADGQIKLLTPPGQDPSVTDINGHGAAVGGSTVRNAKGMLVTTAWHYYNGKFTTLKGENPAATAINEQGVIVGSVGMSPARWRDASAEPEILTVPDFITTPIGVTGLDEDGTMLSMPRVLWQPDGTLSRFPPKFGGVAIRQGWVSGRSGQPFAPLYRLNLRTSQLDLLDGDLTGVHSVINANGWVVGQTKDNRLQLATPSRHLDLLPPPGNDIPDEASAAFISDDGHIIGGNFAREYGPNYELRSIAVLWHCS
jgi:hypothetical protein